MPSMPSALLHRQRALLALLDLQGGKKGRLALMKEMFLLCKEELHADIFDFHPYHHGPFSLTLFADLRTLERQGYVRQSENDVLLLKKPEKELMCSIPEATMIGLHSIVRSYGEASHLSLLRKVYKEYPYYATRNPKCGKRYAFADPRHVRAKQKAMLFTIGYEGKSIDRFLDDLMENNVHVLVDIRNNPVSMKYDFSGSKLRGYCIARDIEYLGIPELGIPSALRRDLDTAEDYRKLFARYRRDVLPSATVHLQHLCELIQQGRRIALMCFEKDPRFCHRNDAASALAAHCSNRYELAHI